LSLCQPSEYINGKHKQQQHQQVDRWPLINYIQSLLEGKGADQKIEALSDTFDQYKPLPQQSVDSFVKQIQEMLWPNCKWFKKLSEQTTEDDDHIIVKRETIPKQDDGNDNQDVSDTSNSNLPDVFALIETHNAYYFLASYRGATLQDLITYNPGVLSSNLKKSFVIYQLLRVIASLHSRGILHGGLKASNILVDENLWIQLAGTEFEPNAIDFGKLSKKKLAIQSSILN
jgi:hypothetical protein